MNNDYVHNSSPASSSSVPGNGSATSECLLTRLGSALSSSLTNILPSIVQNEWIVLALPDAGAISTSAEFLFYINFQNLYYAPEYPKIASP